MTTAWDIGDYDPITGDGAGKLARSAVAPLIAYAQGLSSVTGETVKAFLDANGIDGRSGRPITTAVAGGDALAMPWHTPRDVAHYWNDREHRVAKGLPPGVPAVISMQVKPNPSSLRLDRKGKPQGKYLLLADTRCVLAVHPATPPAWLAQTPPTVWIAEGLLKALSLTTALLVEAGVDPDDLRLIPGESVPDAMVRLRAIMEGIDPASGFLVVALVGVGNWHQNPEWTTIDTRGRNVVVAVDGDVETNPAVARQAAQLNQFHTTGSRSASVRLVRLGMTAGYQPRDGIDDVLARGVPVADILATATAEFPPLNPPGVDGRWRMNPQTLTCQRFEKTEDGSGSWVDAYPYVARVVEVTHARFVSDSEWATGALTDDGQSTPPQSNVQVEFEWTVDGVVRRQTMTGNQNMLWVTPDRWPTSQVGVIMPTRPVGPDPLAFPPSHKEFLGAMLGYRSGETVHRPLWEQMGWVPTEGEPMFVMGEVAAGADGEIALDRQVLAIDDSVMAGWRGFGFLVPDSDEEARMAVRGVFDAYVADDPADAVWTDVRHTAIVLAAALRPVVPIRCQSPIYLTGGTNLGKSYTSFAIMAFWQPRPGVWSPNRLPGSAKDTAAATEMLVARSPIWVTDDVSPNGHDPQAQRRMEGTIDDLIRAVSNGVGKRRATPTMGSARVYKPIALLVVNAEQPTDQASILNRVVHVQVAPGFLNPSRVPTDRLDRVSHNEGLQPLVTGYAVRWMARRIAAMGWAGNLTDWTERKNLHSATIAGHTSSAGGSQRTSGVMGDLLLGLELWDFIIAELGLRDELGPRLSRLYEAFDKVTEDSLDDARSLSLGARFLDGLRSVLAAHQGHVGVLGGGEQPVPVDDTPWGRNAGALNDLLGWSIDSNGPRPGGDRIGTLIWHSDGEQRIPYVMFDQLAAHRVVTTYSQPDMKGNRPRAIWEAIHREGIAATHWAPKPTGSRSIPVLQRVMVGGVSVSGVAVPLDRLVGFDPATSQDPPEAPAHLVR